MINHTYNFIIESKMSGKLRKKYKISNLENAYLDKDEREKWVKSHKEVNDRLPIPTRSSSLGNSTIHNAWFSYFRSRPVENGDIDLSYEEEEKYLVLRTITVMLQTSKYVMKKIKLAMEACAYIYNKCVELAQDNKVDIKELTRMFVTDGGSHIENNIRERFIKIPFAIRNSAVLSFKAAYMTQKKAKKHFEMKFMKKKYRYIEIGKDDLKVSSDGKSILPRFKVWGKKEIKMGPRGGKKITFHKGVLTCSEEIPPINHTVKLYIKNRKLYMAIPVDHTAKKKLTGKVAAIDPGVRTFQTIYDSKGISYSIGDRAIDEEEKCDIEKLDKIKLRACRIREGHKRVWNKETGKYEHTKLRKATKSMKRFAQKLEDKIKNKVSDIHRRTAKFLCDNYDNIIIPPFTVKNMTKRYNRKISKTTCRRLYIWSHYTFRQLLIAKGEQTGTGVTVRNEMYTSKVCSRCLYVNKDLGNKKVFKCPNCSLKISRDVNGARNILIKNWYSL